ncbi:MAG: DNA mismatch repair protein MutS [Cyclobacteriaceae bacterium]|nr:DNA mismatch repair protein MutS [Cyclobacteriaceae bacterium]
MAKAKSPEETPLMKQYLAIKAKYPGALLLFRVGDFYETFGEDAVTASKILDIVLTKRANGAASHIELAGFPHHSLDTYLPKLVRAGQRVAICDQLEDPKSVKGIVKRGVTELVTPGLSMHDNVLDQRKNNYLAALFLGKEKNGIAFLDLSTGEFFVSEGPEDYIGKLVQGFQPAEIIYNKSAREAYNRLFGDQYSTFVLEDWIFTHDFGSEKLIRHFRTQNLKGFGIAEFTLAIAAAGAILHYLDETEHKEIGHISSISRLEEDRYMWLDRFTVRNLELVGAQQADGVSLIEVLDQSVTPMGSRLLKKWMVLPLKDKVGIDQRLDVVDALGQQPELAEGLQKYLRQIGDLERLVSKVATGRINPRELFQLKKGLSFIQPICAGLLASDNTILRSFAERLDDCQGLIDHIDQHLADDPPMNLHQGNVIRTGIHDELDEWRGLAFSGKDYLLQVQQREAENTGISSLKVAYNKVFGYYLEVTNSHKDKVPDTWIRKQTLVNAERYITEELKIYEEKIIRAESELSAIEAKLYLDLVLFVRDFTETIQQNARILARLDCLSNFARISTLFQYTRPVITEEPVIDIKAGRHPVIERLMPADEMYVPNDVFLDSQSQQVMIITGPNMSGKSALLRQTALIVLMAQMGCFVPAGHARIGITDKIFTRVGASDNLSRGESTFMVEMTETASILNNLSDRSLVIMDEIGRGTSTYDGISIAWSIVEHLHNHPRHKARTLFATHYHELNELAASMPRIKNFNVSVKELKDKVIFLRKLAEGGSEHSFGIHVAQMAGMPNDVVIRANEILKYLEKEKGGVAEREKLQTMPTQNFQLNLFEADPRIERLMELLRGVEINTISPVEALLKLNEMKDILKG